MAIQQSQDAGQPDQQAKPENGDNRLLRPRYMSHNRSRSDPNFAVVYERSNQAQMASFTPKPNARSSNHSHFRSPSDPSLNLTKETEPEMPLVDVGSDNEPAPHWNPFSPYYESHEVNFVANPSDVTDDDFASLRESKVKMPHDGSNVSYHQANVEHHQPNAGYQQSNAGYQQTNAGYHQTNAGYHQPNIDHHQPDAGNPPASEFLQGAATDMFRSTKFGGHMPESQQGLRRSSENLDFLDAPARFRDDTSSDPQQELVQDGNNPFLEGYRTSEVEQHLNFADQGSSDSEPEETEIPEYSGINPPLSPGLSDPFGAAPFIVQKSKQVPPPSKDAFGSSPFTAQPVSQSKGGNNQLTDAQRSEQVADTFGVSSPFPSAPAGPGRQASALAQTPFHDVEQDFGNSSPFVGNAEREDPSGLVNPAADFIDNTDDPFGGISFNANPAVKRRNAKKQQGMRREPPVAAPRGDQGLRPRPRRLLPQTPDKAPGGAHAGQRVVSGQARVQGVRVIPVGPSAGSNQGLGKAESKNTGNRSAYAAT